MKICFICHANVCRSFLAQEFLKKILSENKRADIEVISRGTYVLPHFEVPQKIKNFLLKENIIYNGHAPALYSRNDLESSDLILAMTSEQLEELEDKYPQFSDKMRLFLDYCVNICEDMQDPITKENSTFDKIAYGIKNAVAALYSKL